MKEQLKQIPRMLHVQILPETGPIFNVPTFPVGRALFPLSPVYSVVRDIDSRPNGSKLITFRSPIVIQNRTPVQLSVQVTPASSAIEEMIPIESNSCSAVPVRHAYKAGLRFRATEFPSYDWSDQSIATTVRSPPTPLE